MEVAVHCVLKAGDVDAVVTVIDPGRTLLVEGRPGNVSEGGSIVRRGSGPRQQTCR